MKKTYIAPVMVSTAVSAEPMMTTSFELKTTTVGKGAQLGNEQRGEWGNLWK